MRRRRAAGFQLTASAAIALILAAGAMAGVGVTFGQPRVVHAAACPDSGSKSSDDGETYATLVWQTISWMNCNTQWTYAGGDHYYTPQSLEVHGRAWVCGGLVFNDDIWRNGVIDMSYNSQWMHYGSCGLQADNYTYEQFSGGYRDQYVNI